ncbi:MAG: glucosaminidase domain-containing protein [Hyphomicrobiaceae bacterium]|nr:glucosaminidase domain-containing protein [Hyphomicrobiaceae bacterium]
MHRANRVPVCVTPERLMTFLQSRNAVLPQRYRDIALWYQHHGEKLKVRWDFAFFQMTLETNFLTYRRGDGSPGDVRPAQNNFAGIGATGGGVPGDRFSNVGSGVLAQIQHLVAYSGETVTQPVAPRTALKQRDIVESVRRLQRPVRFSDLARRWAADPRYAASIASIADSFYRDYCAPHDRGPIDSSAPGAASPRRGALNEPQGVPPVPRSAAKARGHVVARTIWRRGTTVTAAQGEQLQAMESSPAPPPPEPARRPPPSQDTARLPQPHGFLSGLQAIASSMQRHVAEWPISPPVPRPADRASKIAANN